jgi:hypothetical protein
LPLCLQWKLFTRPEFPNYWNDILNNDALFSLSAWTRANSLK